MRAAGLGVIEDGFTFTEAELARASPRFWWGARKRAAYERVLERRGIRRNRDGEDSDHDSGHDHDSRHDDDRRYAGTAGAAAAAMVVLSDNEKHHDTGRSDGGGGWSDGGSNSSSSGGSDGGGGGE
jgi:uncharacterized membrane protein YgcG